MEDRAGSARSGRDVARRRPRAATAARGRAAQPCGGDASHGIGARQPSRPPGSTRRSGGTTRVLETELLAGVEERRPAAASSSSTAAARARASDAEPRAVAGVSWFESTTVGHAPAAACAASIVRDALAPGGRVPRRVERREDRRRDGARRRGRSTRVTSGVEEEEDLADQHAVAGIGVDQATERAEELVRGGMVVQRRRAAARRRRRDRRAAPGPCRGTCTTSTRKPSTPRSSQKRSDVVHGRDDRRDCAQSRSGCSRRKQCR